MLCLISLFLLTTPLQTQDCGCVSSESASYDGQDLILSGQVIIEHILGKIQAEKALLKKTEKESDFPFSQIKLDQEVFILLKNGQLTADRADFDLQKNQAILSAEQKETATYQDMAYNKKLERMVPFTIAGRILEMQLLAKGEKKEYFIDCIQAEKNVAISYANAFFLTAAKAVYNQLDLKNRWKGTISAYGPEENGNCVLTHEQDVIYAKHIDIDLIHSCLHLSQANGLVQQFLLPKAEKSPMHFSTASLNWNNIEKELLFVGKTRIEEQDLGIINTQDELLIKNCMINDKLVFQTLGAKGHTIMTYKDLKGCIHQIESHGRLYVDRSKLQAWTENLEDENGTVQNPLSYETEDFCVFSDNAQLDYVNVDQRIKPVSIVLKNHIYMFSKNPNKPRQLAVADRMSYSLDTHSLILSAYPGKKVLFWDKAQELKISAPEVHITTDPLTQERVIKGIGNVHFAFSAEEQTLLNQHFSQFLPYE